ncbi:DUF924 family protein [Noviherbaspirillum massiliense]|uniref:DUF924 family protein n=1 Tax=Noviherbaspirillum massiliense TaxID=1465823 RepID=UPI000313649F|nr:DUF924 family protein [Noviherbaspirillum massiliense]
MESIASIHRFWFGDHPDDAVVARQQSRLWWKKQPETDSMIRQRFAPWTAKAAARELDDWLATPAGRLALILLTDQFPRNMYRGTPQAFAFDELARTWAKEGLALGVQHSLRPIERVFLYLPLEHSESLEDQDRSLALFEELAANAAPAQKPAFDGFLDFARRHRQVIERFGRFPHRNAILGRASTPEELAFLRKKGSSF